MKKFLTLKNILLCGAAVFAIVAFILSFTAGVHFKDDEGNGAMFYNFIWGPKRFAEMGYEAAIPSALLPMPVPTISIVGALLVIVGAAAAVVIGLLINKPIAKWVVLGCGAVAVVGGVFFFLFRSGAVAQFAKMIGVTIAQAEATIEAHSIKVTSAGAVVGGILGILAGGSCIASALLPEKK